MKVLLLTLAVDWASRMKSTSSLRVFSISQNTYYTVIEYLLICADSYVQWKAYIATIRVIKAYLVVVDKQRIGEKLCERFQILST